MAKISISGDFRVSPEASDVIFGSSARRSAKENVAKHGAKHSPLFSSCLVALRARIPSFTSSRVFACEPTVLRHLCNRKSQKCELPILVCSLSLSELMSNLKKAMKATRT